MSMRTLILYCLLLITSFTVQARVIDDIEIPETIQVDGTQLVLNGAGVRYKFFFKVYVAALYLEKKSSHVEQILGSDTHRRIDMYVTYSHISQEKMENAWKSGFEANLDEANLTSLAGSINQFIAMFADLHEKDVIVMDYTPGEGTQVLINQQDKGTIRGKAFNDALLGIWLGKEPVTESLKDKLLAIDED